MKLMAPSSFFRDELKKNYLPLIEEKMLNLTGKKISIAFEVIPKEQQVKIERSPDVEADIDETQKIKVSSNTSAKPKSTEAKPNKNAINLNSSYTFDNFVVGENEFPFKAASAISKEPGKDMNPFFIYGGVGLGKTHLMQAIGNTLSEKHEKLKIHYMTGDDYRNDFIKHIENNDMVAYKNKYRSIDVLLLDDIHDLQGAGKAQEELFHTFNALYENKKQMVFTSDRPVTEVKNFSDRLRSRFTRGLEVDLQMPSWETRLAILQKKCELKSAHISNDILEMIAKNITSNIRDLEAALTKLVAWSKLVGKTLTIDLAKEQLKAIFSAPAQSNISIDLIQKVVANAYNLSGLDLRGKKKTQSISLPRQIAMWVTRELTDYSLSEIGTEFGGRDHTTVMHGIEKINNLIKTDTSMDPTLQNLIRSIKESVVRG